MLTGWCGLREGDYPGNEEEERFLVSLFNPSEKESQMSCSAESEDLRMADEQQENKDFSVKFPENCPIEQQASSSEPESNDEKSDVSSGLVFEPPNVLLEYPRMPGGTQLGGRRMLGCKVKPRGTLSMSSNSSMEQSSVDVESSLTDGTADGEQIVTSICEASTQTDVFLPTANDIVPVEEPRQKEGEMSDVGEDRKEDGAAVSDGRTSPLVIIVKAKPTTAKDCPFFFDCDGEGKQEHDTSSQLPVKESIICEDKDNMRILHCLYHKANSPTSQLSGNECDNSTTSSATVTSHPAHQTCALIEFSDDFKSYGEAILACRQSTSNAPEDVASDFNVLPISEEIKRLRCFPADCGKEREAGLSIARRLQCEPDFTMDPVYNDTWYFSRFHRRNPKEDFLPKDQSGSELKVEDISGTEESVETLESNECLQYISGQTSKGTRKSKWTSLEDRLSDDPNKPSLETITKDIKEGRQKMADERKKLLSKVLQQGQKYGDFSKTRSGEWLFPKATEESREGTFNKDEAQSFENTESNPSAEERETEVKKTPKNKSPRRKAKMEKRHSDDNIPTKGKWVENLSDEVKCEKSAADTKKRGKIRQMYKYVRDRFKGKN